MKKTKIILIIAIIIIVFAVIFLLYKRRNTSNDLENEQKKSEIDQLFQIWLEMALENDKNYLQKNETAIKNDLFLKLNLLEIKSLKDYSNSLKDLLSSKKNPLSVLFLTSSAYLISNFNNVKGIISKTNIKEWFDKFGFSNLPNKK